MNTRYTVLGINDECGTCDCCNRTNLKKTVIMERASDGAIVRFGTGCAAEALQVSEVKVKRVAQQKQSDADVKAADVARKVARLAELNAMRTAGAVETEAGQNIFQVIRVMTASLAAAGVTL